MFFNEENISKMKIFLDELYGGRSGVEYDLRSSRQSLSTFLSQPIPQGEKFDNVGGPVSLKTLARYDQPRLLHPPPMGYDHMMPRMLHQPHPHIYDPYRGRGFHSTEPSPRNHGARIRRKQGRGGQRAKE